MKLLRYVLPALVLVSAFGRLAQGQTGDPAHWSYEVKKKSGKEYVLTFHLKLDAGWHIWALKPGGDGFQMIPEYVVAPNADVEQVGKVEEHGKATTTTMDGVDGKVTYLSGAVDYTMAVKVKKNTKITGKHTYQVCNDRQCLAPVDKEFSFDLK